METVKKNLTGKTRKETRDFISSLVKEQGLREFKIYYAKLLDEGCVTNICDIIQKNSALTVLELRGCELQDEHVRRICKALVDTANTMRLQRLILASNQIKDSIPSICEFIKHSKTLSYLDISLNRITFTGFVGAEATLITPAVTGIITTLTAQDIRSLKCILFHGNLSDANYRKTCRKLIEDFNIVTCEEEYRIFQSSGAAAGSAMGGGLALAITDSASIEPIEVIPNDEADLDENALLESFCCCTVPELLNQVSAADKPSLFAILNNIRKRKGDDPEDPPPHRSRGTD